MIDNRSGLPFSAPSVHRAIWAGALIGLLVPIAATAVHLHFIAEDWTASGAWFAHANYPLLWLIDFAPLAAATFAGMSARYRLARATLESRETRLGFDVLTRIAQHAIVIADPNDQSVEWS